MSQVAKQSSELPACTSGSFLIDSELTLTFGDKLYSTVISYSIYGDLNNPVIVVLGGISADQYVADTDIEGILVKGWWDPLVGHGKAIDLNSYCVVSINYLDGLSSGQVDKQDPKLKISTFDQATILNLLLLELGLDSYEAIIGASYGGMVALAFAEKYPSKLGRIIAVCCTDKSSSRNTAFRSIQRQILEFSIAQNDAQTGLVLARSLATLGYRGETEIESRFENNICTQTQAIDFPVIGYLKNQGEKFADRFCADRFINLSLSVDLHHITNRNINVPCLCIGIQGDLIAPIPVVKAMANSIGDNAQFQQIQSKVGHDGFLKEFDQLAVLIQNSLNTNSLGK